MFTRIFWHLTASICAVCTLLLVILHQFWIALPDITPTSFLPQQSIRITDRYGEELYRIFNKQDRTMITGHEIPDHVRYAFIAIEDRRFYDRFCIDPRALLRASLANINEFGSQGGSTITQQLVRTVLLSPEKSIDRKIREAMLACQLEHQMTKDEILDLYLNWTAFGHGISGIEQASQFYFGRSARDVSLEQAAVLAALPQRPSFLSPYGKNHALLISRAGDVLERMEEEHFITENDLLQAENNLLSLTFEEPGHQITAPHFVFWIRDQLENTASSLTVRTTLDTRFQNIVDRAVVKNYNSIAEEFGAKNIAVVLLDRRTREVLAYKGNTTLLSEEEGWVDMTQAPRQPGSSFKPFLYAAAFSSGYTPDSEVIDSPLTIGRYKPKNYEGGYLWRMTMADALGKSRNIPALKTFFRIGGEEPVLRQAASLGAVTPFAVKTVLAKEDIEIDYGWPLALGAAETPLIEMTHAYSTLANNGVYRPLTSIRSITDDSGHQLHRPSRFTYEAVHPFVAENITLALSDEEVRPEGYWRDEMALPDIKAAIKTGTSNVGAHPRDTWTLGYTPEFVLGVWAGNADGTPLFKEANGLTVALPIWKDVMVAAHGLRPMGNRIL